jgi:hypothetical protein
MRSTMLNEQLAMLTGLYTLNLNISVDKTQCFLISSVQTGSGVRLASYAMGRRLSGKNVKLTAHLHLMAKSRMMEA